jgi:hypothetical protein
VKQTRLDLEKKTLEMIEQRRLERIEKINRRKQEIENRKKLAEENRASHIEKFSSKKRKLEIHNKEYMNSAEYRREFDECHRKMLEERRKKHDEYVETLGPDFKERMKIVAEKTLSNLRQRKKMREFLKNAPREIHQKPDKPSVHPLKPIKKWSPPPLKVLNTGLLKKRNTLPPQIMRPK